MKYLELEGGIPLRGELRIQGSKNAALPILAASMLGDGPCILENCPIISDVEDTLDILEELGCRVCRKGETLQIDGSDCEKCVISETSASRIRSSVLFLGVLLGKIGKAVLPWPGGCAIGERPIDLHLEVLKKLGAFICQDDVIHAEAVGLQGSYYHFPIPSVGATENAILASVLAQGETVLENCAQEPEVLELCRFLSTRGAKIRISFGRICIQGVRRLYPVTYRISGDRIVGGTYLLAAMATEGNILLDGVHTEELMVPLYVMRKMGAVIRQEDERISLCMRGRSSEIPYLETAPYPGFPTDLQSPLMAVLCRGRGKSILRETIFEERFRTAEELRKLGANICIKESAAEIFGKEHLYGNELMAPDLRGGAAIVISALQAVGKSTVYGVSRLERGYEDICRDLSHLGASIKLIEEKPSRYRSAKESRKL